MPLEELWEEVRNTRSAGDKSRVTYMRKEAKQLAAMALRLMVDVC